MVEQETLHLLVGHGGGDGVPAEHLADLFFRGVVQLGKAGDLASTSCWVTVIFSASAMARTASMARSWRSASLR